MNASKLPPSADGSVSASGSSKMVSHSSPERVGRTPVASVAGRVGFKSGKDPDESRSEREKYLTARYPKSQMSMIRRRLAVEDWVDSELKKIYNVSDDDYGTYDAEIDLDEVLDLDTDAERESYINEHISNAPASEALIHTFVCELLEKLQTL